MTNHEWTLIWQDEFDRKEIDRTRWRLDVGYTGEANGELEIYTDRSENACIENSCLVIVAREENYQGYRYTSARLKTQGLHSWVYGRVEARIKIPTGYYTLAAENVPSRWVFDHPFFILLNVAVGGHWPGYPDETTIFPQFMVVDYVRVYSKEVIHDKA